MNVTQHEKQKDTTRKVCMGSSTQSTKENACYDLSFISVIRKIQQYSIKAGVEYPWGFAQ